MIGRGIKKAVIKEITEESVEKAAKEAAEKGTKKGVTMKGGKAPKQKPTIVIKNNKEARDIAAKLGYKEVKDFPFNSKGELVFKKGNKYISRDNTGHKGGAWKLYDNKGNRTGTFTKDLKTYLDK